MQFPVLLDANVLYPNTLRDVLLWAADAYFYRLYLTEQILEEVRRNLLKNIATMTEQKVDRMLNNIRSNFPESFVVGYEILIDKMPNHPGDRHVVAAALKAGAQVIVTNNLKHFRDLPADIEAQSADEFLCHQYHLKPDQMVAMLHSMADKRKAPPMRLSDLLKSLEKETPRFVELVRTLGE